MDCFFHLIKVRWVVISWLLWFEGGFWNCYYWLAFLCVANVLDVALWTIMALIAVITYVRVLWAAFITVLDHRRTHLFWVIDRCAIRQLIPRLTFITSVRCWAFHTVVNTEYNLAVFAWVTVLTLTAYSRRRASTLTLLWASHLTLIPRIPRPARFASILIPRQAFITVVNIALQALFSIVAQHIPIVAGHACVKIAWMH